MGIIIIFRYNKFSRNRFSINDDSFSLFRFWMHMFDEPGDQGELACNMILGELNKL